MTLVIVAVVSAVGGAVFGILFGRKNTKKVEADLAIAKALLKKAGIDA